MSATDDEDEVSPWESAEREKDISYHVHHVIYHISPKSFILLFLTIQFGVCVGILLSDLLKR